MFRLSAAAASGVVVCAIGAGASAGLPGYSLVGQFSLPGGVTSYDVMPDGRLIAMQGETILMQDAVNSGSYSVAGSIPSGSVASFGASFLSVNPSGTLLAIGDNELGVAEQNVHFVDVSSLSPSVPSALATVTAPNFEAHWADDSTLYVTGADSFGSPSQVSRIDAGALTVDTVVSGIQGASAGVATDGQYLYTANGFANGTGSETGNIRAFDLSMLAAGGPLNFETDGVLVADTLSGGNLGFDQLGNLHVGGGDAFGSGDAGYAGVVDGDAIAAALTGGGAATDSDELRLSPEANDFYSVTFNEHTLELLVSPSGSGTIYRYAIPGPGTGVALAAGLCAARRRRRGA